MIPNIKSHLLIQDKFLGALIYLKDSKGRGYLKLSFKNKIADFVKGADIPTRLPVPVKLEEPVGLDVSYKFQDSLLEVKKVVDSKVEPEFYKIPLPVENCLFIIKIKNWHLLDTAQKPDHPIVLTPPNDNNSVAVIFSFVGANGLPFKPEEYDCVMGVIDLPGQPLSQFCIGIAKDPNNTSINGFEVHIPFPKQNV